MSQRQAPYRVKNWTGQKERRDTNEKYLEALWVRVGCTYIRTAKNAGFDGILIAPRTGLHVVEVKNPEQDWELTPNEKMVKALLESIGVKYNIIQTEAEALELAGC